MLRVPLPLCRWRVQHPHPGRIHCRSPLVAAGPHGLAYTRCYVCPDCDHLDQAAPAPAADQAGAVRHLLFHLYPVGSSWQWHCATLRRYMPLFNGRRILSVAVGPETATRDQVQAELGCDGVEIRAVRNDPGLKEVASYRSLIASLSSYRGPGDCHFYAHGKGVVTEAWGPACRRWTEAMYEALLGHWTAVRRALQDHAAVGIFRRLWRGPVQTLARWHYSGTFRWVRHADFYARDWTRVDAHWLGAETHVGMVFGKAESCCLYGEFATQDIGLYADSEWERWAEPRRREWVAEHQADREDPHCVTVLLTSHRQPELVHQAIASVLAQTTDQWQLIIIATFAAVPRDAFDRYRSDARITIIDTGEGSSGYTGPRGQGAALNRAIRSGMVQGDLVACLSDDDMLAPRWLGAAVAAAVEHPDQAAWWGIGDRQELAADGRTRRLGKLLASGVIDGGHKGRGQIDGGQVVVRRDAWQDWPEGAEQASQADGYWIDEIAWHRPIHPVDQLALIHRHTPDSTFTQAARGPAKPSIDAPAPS